MSDTPEDFRSIGKITATPFSNGDIALERVFEDSGIKALGQDLTIRIMHTEEEAVKKALIALGWTPPEGRAAITDKGGEAKP